VSFSILHLRSWSALVVIAWSGMTLVACSADTSKDDANPAADTSELRASAERSAEKLAALLDRRGTVMMPPTGQGDATFLRTKANLLPFDGDVDVLARAEAREAIVDRYALPESVLERFQLSAPARFEEEGTKFEIGLAGESVEDYVVNKLTSRTQRDEVRALVRNLPG
jgi:hypothetical protein